MVRRDHRCQDQWWAVVSVTRTKPRWPAARSAYKSQFAADQRCQGRRVQHLRRRTLHSSTRDYTDRKPERSAG